MAHQTILHIRQDPTNNGTYPITLRLDRPGKPDIEATAQVAFALSEQEQEDIRWYMEDYLHRADAVAGITVQQIEEMMRRRGEELYHKVLKGGTDDANARDVRRIFERVFDHLPDLRIKIVSDIAEAASIPWELMREPSLDSAIALHVKSFVRVQSNRVHDTSGGAFRNTVEVPQSATVRRADLLCEQCPGCYVPQKRHC